MNTLTVGDLMTSNFQTIDVQEDIKVARLILEYYDLRYLVVTDQEKVLGFLSESDVNFNVGWMASPGSLMVGDIFIQNPCVLDHSMSFEDAITRMTEEGAKFAIVVRESVIIGTFAVSEACDTLGRFFHTIGFGVEHRNSLVQ